MNLLQSKWAQILTGAVIVCVVLAAHRVEAHGGVVEEDDICVIKISYLKAHFKVYQIATSGHEQYCEDLPDTGESIFVMEYLHDELARVPVDFRIIRNVTDKGLFARLQDVEAIDDLDSVTVFYQPPVIEPDVFTVLHDFTEKGEFIGVVTAQPDTNDRLHIAVFPFEVGYTQFGHWPLIILVLLIVQFQYLLMSGRIAKWRAARRIRTPELAVVAGKEQQDAT